ncbi:MAG: mannose-6-phosphate isomerase [Turicibacter sp.]|nr:mannose-6-phosphate isomerase [Turicibacter sp.]
MSVLFFKPIPRIAVWGKNHVKHYFGYDDFPGSVGQAWAFSGLAEASNLCLTAPYNGKTLHQLWEENQALFGHKKGEFPLIISLVAPEDDLSIQVHPDAVQAQKIGFSMGKNEAWYFMEPPTSGQIVYGHHAKDPEDMDTYIKKEQWEQLIDYLPVKQNDFVYLPAGILHALQKGSIVYEIQQATDITYRFFDYHRKDDEGNERELHVEQALACVSYGEIKNTDTRVVEGNKTTYITNDSFTVAKLEINGKQTFQDDNYQLATVIAGTGEVAGTAVTVGSNFLIPTKTEVIFDGKMTVMMTTRGE